MMASTLDANNQIFLLVMAIMDPENDASYDWFFQNFGKAVGSRDDFVIVSNRHNSIQKAVKNV